MHVSFSHHSPAYLDEQYPIVVNITNNDERELAISLDVLLQPGDDGSGEYYPSLVLGQKSDK